MNDQTQQFDGLLMTSGDILHHRWWCNIAAIDVAVFDRNWQCNPFQMISWPFIILSHNDISEMSVGIGPIKFDCCHIVTASDDDNGKILVLILNIRNAVSQELNVG